MSGPPRRLIPFGSTKSYGSNCTPPAVSASTAASVSGTGRSRMVTAAGPRSGFVETIVPRASVAVILGLLLTVGACATAAPQGHAPAAASRHGHGPVSPGGGPRVAALAAATEAEAGAAGPALPAAPAGHGGGAASSGRGP